MADVKGKIRREQEREDREEAAATRERRKEGRDAWMNESKQGRKQGGRQR